MKNVIEHVKANKALYIRRSLVVIATGATIAVVAYAVKHGADDSIEEFAELADVVDITSAVA